MHWTLFAQHSGTAVCFHQIAIAVSTVPHCVVQQNAKVQIAIAMLNTVQCIMQSNAVLSRTLQRPSDQVQSSATEQKQIDLNTQNGKSLSKNPIERFEIQIGRRLD